jgi:outer membrane protein TolC
VGDSKEKAKANNFHLSKCVRTAINSRLWVIFGFSMLRSLVSVFFLVALVAACARAPEPLDRVAVSKELQSDLDKLGVMPDAIDAPLSLYQAIARAILYNREYKLAAMETALSQRQYDLAKSNILPALTLSAGYSQRDKYAASASTTFDGNTPAPLGNDPSYSVSQDKNRSTANAVFTWNILDFGLSYVRAGQSADRRMIAIERHRKVVHNIVREVTSSYWRAVAAENLLGELGPLLRRVEDALLDSRRIETRRLSPPLEALIYQKELLEIRRTLHTQQRALMTAKLELAQLMGLMPGQQFQLAKVEYIIPEVAMNISLMENTALLSRPELMETRYQKRINQSEVRAALLSMMPNLNFTASANSDDSDYQKYNDYVEMGAQVSYNLMSAFSGPKNRDVAKASVDVAEAQRLAMAMAVVSQVHIANMNFAQARQEYAVAEDYLSVSKRLTKQTRDAQRVAKFGELEVIRQEASLLLAQMRRDIAFAELQNSFGTIYASVGLDILPNNVRDMSIKGLSSAISTSLQTWGLKYKSVMAAGNRVRKPISQQNPVLGANGFTFAADTFSVGQPVAYSVGMQNGTRLPDWLSFDPATRKISGRPPKKQMQLSLRVIAQGPEIRATDSFILQIGNSAQNAPKAKKSEPIAKPIAKPAPKPVSAAPKPTATDKQANRFVQAKALSNRTAARKFADGIIAKTGLPTFIRKTKRLNPPLYRIIIPAFSRSEIKSIREQLSAIGITDSFVTRQ